jgi:hypothetical protein
MIATYSLRGVTLHDCDTVEQEADTVGRQALAFAEHVHQLLQLGSALDLEEHLEVSIGDPNVEKLVGVALRRGGGVSVGHNVEMLVGVALRRGGGVSVGHNVEMLVDVALRRGGGVSVGHNVEMLVGVALRRGGGVSVGHNVEMLVGVALRRGGGVCVGHCGWLWARGLC